MAKTTRGNSNSKGKRTAKKYLTLVSEAQRGLKNNDHYLNGVNTKAGSCFQIWSKIIKKDGLRRLQAEPLQAQLIHPGVWLADTFQAGFYYLREGQEGEINVPKIGVPVYTLVCFFEKKSRKKTVEVCYNK